MALRGKTRSFHFRSVGLWLFLGAASAAVSCGSETPGKKLAAGCSVNSDCDGQLVCKFGRCHAECSTSKDCPAEDRCAITENVGVCLLEAEELCGDEGVCAGTLVCASDLACRSGCTQRSDCLADQVCAAGGVCADTSEVDGDGHLIGKRPDGGAGGAGAGGAGAGGSTSSGGSTGTGGEAGADDAGAGGGRPDADAGPRIVTLTSYMGTAQSNLPWVAGADGDGPFATLSGRGGRYDLTVTGERYSFAYMCPSNRVQTLNLTVGEVVDPTAVCAKGDDMFDVSGSFAGVAATDRIWVCLSWVQHRFPGSQASYFFQAPRGTWDALAARTRNDVVDRLIVSRGLDVFSATVLDLDFAAAGVAPESRTLTLTGAADGETVTTHVTFRTSRGTAIPLVGPAGSALFAPEAVLTGNDIHVVNAFAIDDAAGTQRSAHVHRRTAADVTLELPPRLEAEVAVEATSPQVRFSATFDVVADGVEYDAVFIPTGGLAWLSRMSPGWLATGAPRATYTFPDFSALDGFDPTWAPPTGVETQYEVAVFTSNRPASFSDPPRTVTAPGLEGLELTQSQKLGLIIP